MGEFLQRTARLDEMQAKLAGKLNSNESFNPDLGFHVDVVETAPPEVPSLNLPCNLLGDDAAGIMSWSGRSSMLNCVN